MSKSIDYEKLIEKYCLSNTDVLKVTNSILKNSGLDEIQSELNGRLTQEKIYVLVKSLCLDLMGEDISLVCPKIVKQRKKLSENAANKKSNDGINLSNKKDKDFLENQSAEDIMKTLQEYFYEIE